MGFWKRGVDDLIKIQADIAKEHERRAREDSQAYSEGWHAARDEIVTNLRKYAKGYLITTAYCNIGQDAFRMRERAGHCESLAYEFAAMDMKKGKGQ